MIKYTRFFILFVLTIIAFGVKAQSTAPIATTSSPYSMYGLGKIDPALLPQNTAMGGIATAINRISGYNNINPLNPASYGTINFTTIDVGIYSSIDNLSQTGQTSAKNTNFRLSHIAFAIPVTKHSAVSFGLLPYSEMGYNYKQTSNGFKTGSPVDTNAVNYLYNGNGGISKAYLGYGFGIGKHLLIGANVSYLFGNIQQFSSTEIPGLYGTLNSRIEQSNAVGGFNYDLGAQYSFDFGDTKHLVLGYSTSLKSSINSTSSYIVSQYTYDASGNENLAADSIINHQSTKSKIQLPQINHFGVSFQNDGHFLIGADYTMGKWSSLNIDGTNAGLQDSKTFNLGGQYTPDINALHNYFARADYRLGFIYSDTYLNVNNTSIKQKAVTFGIGLPLAPNNLSFYKINLSAEVGTQGTLNNGLIKENYINIHLGFTFNDKWFQRFKFQ
ncbi:MAG: hypothetical protein JWQ63_3399 [Mucilaginibacter sp.]|jgi:hypothetical protein|nr:hypothetical protein [Mucilaginibacter sp.]